MYFKSYAASEGIKVIGTVVKFKYDKKGTARAQVLLSHIETVGVTHPDP
jgi:hypothetical protein